MLGFRDEGLLGFRAGVLASQLWFRGLGFGDPRIFAYIAISTGLMVWGLRLSGPPATQYNIIESVAFLLVRIQDPLACIRVRSFIRAFRAEGRCVGLFVSLGLLCSALRLYIGFRDLITGFRLMLWSSRVVAY